MKSTESSIKDIMSGAVDSVPLATLNTFHAASAAPDKAHGGHASAGIHKVTSTPTLSNLSLHKPATDSDKSVHTNSTGSLAGTASVVSPTSSRPPRPQKTNTALTHIEDDLLHHGHMVPLLKDVGVMHMHVTVDPKTAQEIQDHTHLSLRQKQATAGMRAHHSSFIKPSALHTGAQLSITPRRRSFSPSASTLDEIDPEAGHRLLRSEVPDELVDSIESLIDAQILQSGPRFAKQTIHSLISAATVVHPKEGKPDHKDGKSEHRDGKSVRVSGK
jgi:hypothetical protein